MRWFTREWSDLPEAEARERREAYWRQVEEMELPDGLRRLARQGLDGAVLRRVLVDRRIGQLVLFFHHADAGRPLELEVLYHRADLERVDLEALRSLTQEGGTEVLGSEVELEEDGAPKGGATAPRPLHRLLLRAAGGAETLELELPFREAAVVERPAAEVGSTGGRP